MKHNFAPANAEYITPHLEGRVDLGSLQGKPVPERRWLVNPWVPLGTVTMLSGDGGTGKSILTLQMLTAAALGKKWLGLDTMRCKALGIFCEDSEDEIHRRMADVLAHYGAEFSDLEDLEIHSLLGEENALMDFTRDEWRWNVSERYHQISRKISESGAQLIVLDSLHDLFPGNENARPEVRRFIQTLAAWALNFDAAVVLNAHPSMSGLNSGSGTSGSTAWNNAVRSRLYLSRMKQDDGAVAASDVRTLTRHKANYASVGDSRTLRWAGGVFIDEPEPTGLLLDLQNIRAETAFLACLKTATEQGRSVGDASNSARYAPKVFAAMPERDNQSKRDLEGAMQRLFSAGTIKIGRVRGADRHPINAIVLSAGSAGSPQVSP